MDDRFILLLLVIGTAVGTFLYRLRHGRGSELGSNALVAGGLVAFVGGSLFSGLRDVLVALGIATILAGALVSNRRSHQRERA